MSGHDRAKTVPWPHTQAVRAALESHEDDDDPCKVFESINQPLRWFGPSRVSLSNIISMTYFDSFESWLIWLNRFFSAIDPTIIWRSYQTVYRTIAKCIVMMSFFSPRSASCPFLWDNFKLIARISSYNIIFYDGLRSFVKTKSYGCGWQRQQQLSLLLLLAISYLGYCITDIQ